MNTRSFVIRLFFIGALATYAFSTNALYAQVLFKDIPNGFEGTKWGTSKEAFVQKHPQMTPMFTAPMGEKKNIVTLFDPNDVAHAIFYYFVDDKLEGLSENPQKGPDFMRLTQEVKEKYGEPNKQQDVNFTVKGEARDAHTSLWNGEVTDIEITFIEQSESSQPPLIASISYFQPNVRATTNLTVANYFYLKYDIGIPMPEFGKAFENLDWGVDIKSVSSQYSGIKFSPSSDTSLTSYEGLASPIPYSRKFIFAGNKLVAVMLTLTNEQARLVYGSRVALVQQLSSVYGRPKQEPSHSHPLFQGRDWFSERYDLEGNANTEVYINFMRPLETPDPGDDAFAFVQVVFFSKGVLNGM